MTFKTLEQRFNQRFGINSQPQDPGGDPSTLADRELTSLYDGAKQRFDKGKPTDETRAEPYVVRAPGEGYWQNPDALLGRAIPLRSVAEDVKRITSFSLSGKGKVFYIKQQLLQTGNTFQITRVINPAFALGAAAAPAIGNAVRIRRHARPVSDGLLTKTDRSDTNVKKMGQLQKETWQTLQDRFKAAPSTFVSKMLKYEAQKPGVISRSVAKVGELFKQLTSPISNTVKALGANRSVGDDAGIEWERRRPELISGSYSSMVDVYNKGYQDGYINTTLGQRKHRMVKGGIGQFTSPYFQGSQATVNSTAQGQQRDNSPATVNAKSVGENRGVYIRDPLNIVTENPQALLDDRLRKNPNTRAPLASYNGLVKGVENDAIYVAFAMGDRMPIQFRAFIKDLNQSITPEYKPYQYIGRPEKFFSYISTQREISFKLGIIAMGSAELDTVWTRINYLTGLAYPFGVAKGIFQPNIVRMTIGDLYIEQPGYISSLSTNFNELGETWDIDRQIPIAAQMDIKFTLIEKRSKTAASPFYGITEKLESFAKTEELQYGEQKVAELRAADAKAIQDQQQRQLEEAVRNTFEGHFTKTFKLDDVCIFGAQIKNIKNNNVELIKDHVNSFCDLQYSPSTANVENKYCKTEYDNYIKLKVQPCVPPTTSTNPPAPGAPAAVTAPSNTPAPSANQAGGIGATATAATTPGETPTG